MCKQGHWGIGVGGGRGQHVFFWIQRNDLQFGAAALLHNLLWLQAEEDEKGDLDFADDNDDDMLPGRVD